MKRNNQLSNQEKESKRLQKNRKAREKHWRKTNVSESTINWMKKTGWL